MSETRRRTLAFGALAAGLLVGAGLLAPGPVGAEPPEPDLAGSWELAGWNLGEPRTGAPSYRGQVEVTAHDNHTYTVEWQVGGKVVNEGVGLYDPETGAFACGYTIGDGPGVAIFRATADDGSVWACRGTFRARIGEVAHEEWTRAE